MTTVVRTATEDDLAALLGLYAELHPDDPVLPPERAARIWREIAGQPGRTVLVAVRDGAVVGTVDGVVVANLTRGGRPFMLVENVIVTHAARRLGVAGRLFDTVVDLARTAGCYKVQLLSRVDRLHAHRFYESCGLRPTAQGYRLYLD
ncbi:GNAT family N-acetyltransferase [Verrucosispora sp. NA02020]|uniref:GNAT family N-acetyltransferase n=1 Tax=unclassified Micromonospora TaxID=2617518 RepID=UPI001591D2B2|nr:GNAT family N-acetyltransferase [Verrucosispora sp. NA02020]QKW13899.1 GNAT family N-acetyltransferase [Verrucosispora sp. NA02020]